MTRSRYTSTTSCRLRGHCLNQSKKAIRHSSCGGITRIVLLLTNPVNVPTDTRTNSLRSTLEPNRSHMGIHRDLPLKRGSLGDPGVNFSIGFRRLMDNLDELCRTYLEKLSMCWEPGHPSIWEHRFSLTFSCDCPHATRW